MMKYFYKMFFVIVLQLIAMTSALAADRQLLDDFEDVSAWAPFPADGVTLKLSADTGRLGKALRMDFGFTGGGYAVARRKLDLDLPENYAFTFDIRGDAPVNHLELKFLDESGENVWWYVRRDMTFPRDWTLLSTKKRQITFAWGPLPGELKHVAAVEIVVTAGTGGTGTVWVDDFALVPLPPPGATPPAPTAEASTEQPNAAAAFAVDNDSLSAWRPAELPAGLTIDYGILREFGAVTLDWGAAGGPSAYYVSGSEDGRAWTTLASVQHGNGGRDDILLPESEWRYLRIDVPPPADPTSAPPLPRLADFRLQPLEIGASREAFFGMLARAAPRGAYPRGMIGEPVSWTVVGPDDSPNEMLFSADGAIEVGPAQFSIEPFLEIDGKRFGWADVSITQDQVEGLPIPRVIWTARDARMTITAFDAGGNDIGIDYEIENRTTRSIRTGLMLGVRPFQVNPPAQFLNLAGGTARIHTIERHGAQLTGMLKVNERQISIAHGEVVAAPFESGDVVADWLRTGKLPATPAAYDTFEAASGLVNMDELTLTPGSVTMYRLSISFNDGTTSHRNDDLGDAMKKWVDLLHVPRIEVPPAAQPLIESMNAQLGYILINRAGPAIQPGTRAYARSWIRDGSLTSSALLRLGHFKEVAEFIKWFAPHQFESGKIPCVVDKRGADPVPEHDSSGEFIFLVAEYLRYTGDRKLAKEMWPRVERAAVYLDTLRHERRTEAWRAPDKVEFFGLLPPSISHEGYSAKPMHSYWDDAFAYRGFKDAAWLAKELGHKDEAAHWDSVAEEFGRDLGNSVAAARKRHDIAYIPGCADLGDFDATSTTIFLSPTGASTLVTPEELAATFDRYETFFTERAAGAPWEAFTPYEIRNVGAFVRLGRRDRAVAMAEWFMSTQQPEGWRQWPEVVWHPGTPQKFIGDLPHTWVGSDFIRSVLDMFVYVREDDRALVVGAGIPTAWLDDPAGINVEKLPTPWGPLTFTMRRERNTDPIDVTIEGLTTLPPDGLVVRAPGCPDAVVTALPAKLSLSAN